MDTPVLYHSVYMRTSLPRPGVGRGRGRMAGVTAWRTVRAAWTVVVVLGLCGGCVKSFNLDPGAAQVFEGPADSYFGFSVSLHSNSQGEWLLVGAPKATDIYQSSVNTSGALYQCPLHQRSPCTQVKLDDTGNEQETVRFVQRGRNKIRLRYSDYKDYQWLGVSVDSHQTGQGGVVVCSHKWADKRYIRSGQLMVNGACYVTDGDLSYNSSRRLMPLTGSPTQQVDYRTHEFKYAYGQVGMTAQYAQNGEKLLLGAPGLRDWTGGYAEYAASNEYVAVHIPGKVIPKTGYIGYALASGQFYGTDQTFYVTSGPRIDMHGRVIISTGMFDIKAEVHGKQMGEYFGGALCVTDLNQDGFDDLIVGAPLYKSKSYEEGRVAVYLMRHTHVFDHVFDLVGSGAAGSRFGSAITSVDLTQDGYPDLVIGAPYEDSGRGAIYVYNGYRHGVRETHSQRLAASSIHPALTGLGHALTSPRTRHHLSPVLAVGSYSSNMAVVLSTRPLVVVQLNASVYPTLINPTVVRCQLNNITHSPRSCLAVGVAFKYTGQGLPDTSSFTVTVRADVARLDDVAQRLPLRGGFQNGTVKRQGITYHALPEYTAHVDDWPAHTAWKDHFIFVLNKHVVDVITPVSISVEVDLVTSQDVEPDTPQPMVDKYCQRSIMLVVPFDKFCGEDNHCKTDLQLHAYVQWPSPDIHYVILGQQQPISIEIHVNNVGEKAYMTSLTVMHPPDLQYSATRPVGGSRSHVMTGSSHVTCTPHASPEDVDANNGSALLMCDVGNPVPDLTMRSLVIVFRRPEVYHEDSFRRERMYVTVSTRTRSQEAYLGNNDVMLELPVKVSAEIDISGVSYPEQHVYEVQSDNYTTGGSNDTIYTTQLTPVVSKPEVYHIYDLRNDGPGLFPGGHIEVTVPVDSLEGHRLVDYIVEIMDDATAKERPNLGGSDKRRARRDVVDDNSTSGSEDEPTSAVPLTSMTPGALFGRSRMQPLDLFCGSTRCEVSKHALGPLNVGDSVTVSIFMVLHMDNLTKLQDTGAVRVLSKVLVRGLPPASSMPLYDRQVATLVTPRHAVNPDSSVPWWVVAASVGVGLVLLLVVVGVLYKFDFFTRAEREELVKLIGQNEENEEQEARMFRVGDNRPVTGAEADWESYDPWQPQSPETSLLIWHANGSISHNSRDEYLTATRRSTGSSSTHDRNLNERTKSPRHVNNHNRSSLNDSIPSESPPSLPSTSGSNSGDRRGLRHSTTSRDDDDVFYDANNHPRSFEIPHYLVIRPAEDSDEDQLFTEPPNTVPNGHMVGSRL